MRAALIVTLCVTLTACGGGGVTDNPQDDGSNAGPMLPTSRDKSVWRGTADIVGQPQRSLLLVTDGAVWRYLVSPSGESGTVFFGNIQTSEQGSAFLRPPKGGSLSNGSAIDSGASLGRFNGSAALAMEIDYQSTGDQVLRATLDSATTNVDATPTRIAGRYSGTAADGTRYTFDITEDGRFVGVDSLGCRYNLTTTFRESRNLYSSSGNHDPNCDTGGANFIDAAFWDSSFRTSTWFVNFRGIAFTLAMGRQ